MKLEESGTLNQNVRSNFQERAILEALVELFEDNVISVLVYLEMEFWLFWSCIIVSLDEFHH